VPVAIRIMVDGAWEIAHRKGWCGDDDITTFQERSYGWKVGLTRLLQRRWWRWSGRIVACSEFLRQILIRHHGVPPEKVQRIFNAYHGPDPAGLRESPAEARQRLGLDPGKRYLLTICRLMVWKGVDGILRALARCPEDVHLLVAGDGDMEAPWKALAAELGIAERAHFLGNVPHERIPLLIRAADVFVLNSRYEGLSHTLLEVQALGTPIVASAVCGNPEVVEDGSSGLLVPPRDDEALLRAVRALLEDPALARRLVEAGRAGSGRFRREATFAEVEALLARVAVR
jgi:glycosyltransferase involved in cell wall biosynthesis